MSSGCKRCGKNKSPASLPIIRREGTAVEPAKRAAKVLLGVEPNLEAHLLLTAAIRDLHTAYPGMFMTGVTPIQGFEAIWANNPYISTLNSEDVAPIFLNYGVLGEQKNFLPHHAIEALTRDLEMKLGVRIPCSGYQGEIFLSDQETVNPLNIEGFDEMQPFWVLETGKWSKTSAKWWNPAYFQSVIDHFYGKIKFVLVGPEKHPKQCPFASVIDLSGRCSLRQVIKLVYHASGALCTGDFFMHLVAATPQKPGFSARMPCVALGGGSEPANWLLYPHHRYFSTQGALKCCAKGACGRKFVIFNEKSKEEGLAKDFCTNSQRVNGVPVAKCMQIISSESVIDAIQSYYDGGILK